MCAAREQRSAGRSTVPLENLEVSEQIRRVGIVVDECGGEKFVHDFHLPLVPDFLNQSVSDGLVLFRHEVCPFVVGFACPDPEFGPASPWVMCF